MDAAAIGSDLFELDPVLRDLGLLSGLLRPDANRKPALDFDWFKNPIQALERVAEQPRRLCPIRGCTWSPSRRR